MFSPSDFLRPRNMDSFIASSQEISKTSASGSSPFYTRSIYIRMWPVFLILLSAMKLCAPAPTPRYCPLFQ